MQEEKTTMTRDHEIQRLIDRAAIVDLINRFAHAVDRRDWQVAADCYHPDAIDLHGIFNGPAPSFLDFVKNRHELIDVSMHHNTNISPEFVDSTTAIVETYCIAWQRMPVGNDSVSQIQAAGARPGADTIEIVSTSRYVDHVSSRDGQWRIQQRKVLIESSFVVTPEARGADMAGVMDPGRRDRSDYYYELRERLRAAAGIAA
jgi:hypothetical protein